MEGLQQLEHPQHKVYTCVYVGGRLNDKQKWVYEVKKTHPHTARTSGGHVGHAVVVAPQHGSSGLLAREGRLPIPGGGRVDAGAKGQQTASKKGWVFEQATQATQGKSNN